MKNSSCWCCFLFLAFACEARASCAYNIPADVNGDCRVDFMDLALITAHWHLEGPTEPNQLWLAKYDGPTHNSDGATALAIDDRGNVYATGHSYGSGDLYCDYVTVKYDSNGSQVWLARYDGDANRSDGAAAIALDDACNVFVTGWSEGAGTSCDYATIRYDPNGKRIWVARYDGPDNGFDKATDLVADDSCNVYVTGYAYWSGAADYDYITIKYDANGTQLWKARYNGPGNYSDKAYAIAIDDACNVYVTGLSYHASTYWDCTTIKYDPNGNQLWAARYNGPGGGIDAGFDIALDDACNVYITGYAYGSDVNLYDYATIKYEPNGNQLWASLYNGPGNNYDEACDIALDASGAVYVTGRSWGVGSDFDYATVKYDGDGNEVWAARYDGPAHDRDEAAALAVREPNCIYVTGCSRGSASSGDYATIKYDGDGNEIWVGRYNGPADEWDDAYAIALDPVGNLYVTGCSDNPGPNRDYITIRYDYNGKCLAAITGDVNMDCVVDLEDLAMAADHWLECSLDPPEQCPQ